MFLDYKYQIIFGSLNEITPSNCKIYSNSIDDAYNYIEFKYNHIIKKEKWTIDKTQSFDSDDTISVLYSEYYNIDCIIRLIDPDEIVKTIEFYKNIENKIKNKKQITIKSLYIVKIPETNLIKLLEFENNFSIYQNKYLNLIGYIQVENSEQMMMNILDPEYLTHIEIEKKIIWFLQNHFRKKTLDNEIILSNHNNQTNYILDYNNDDFIFDDETNVIMALYNIILN